MSKTTNIIAKTISMMLVSVLLVTTFQTAVNADVHENTINSYYEDDVINAVAPSKITRETTDEHSNFYTSSGDTQLIIPKVTTDKMTFSCDAQESIEVRLLGIIRNQTTENINDAIVFQGENYNIGIEPFSNGFRETFLIMNENDLHEYTMNFNSSNLSYLNFAYNGEGKTDGSILLFDEKGDTLGAIDSAWAVDKSGKEVKTYYIIEGKSITQVIKPTNDTEYPIIADPTYSTYFYSSKWISRSGKHGISLSINPKSSISSSYPSVAQTNDAWNKIVSKHKNDSKWKNAAGLKDQFECHVYGAKDKKTPWNIEPSRPNVGYTRTVLAKCNPN